MGTVDLTKVASSSMFPGLQNIGTSSATVYVTGTLEHQANLTGTGLIRFPRESMASIRVQLPDANGDLASYWFPVIGSIQLYDATAGWYLTLYTQPDDLGRGVSFCFTSNQSTNDISFSSFRISLFAHLYTYPF